MLARTPTVSIIMPVYNNGAYIAAAINSVLKQTYASWELIIVDDGSTDNTPAILENARKIDRRIYAHHLPNNSGGASKPRNEGLNFAVGRYIAFLDADDIWLEGKLEQQLQHMEENNAAISCTAFRVMTPDGKLTNRLLTAPPVIDMQSFLKKTNIGLSTSMIDRRKVGAIRFNESVAVEDFELWSRLLKKHDAHCLGTELVHYRRGHKSLSSNKFRSAFNQLGNYYQLRHQIGAMPAATAFASYALNAIKKRL